MESKTFQEESNEEDPEYYLPKKIPYLKLLILSCIIACDALGITFLFPFVAFMVSFI
jgi:hypothetical protein